MYNGRYLIRDNRAINYATVTPAKAGVQNYQPNHLNWNATCLSDLI